MPKEIFEKEKFIELSKEASLCMVKTLGDITKLKLRTKKYLYTIKLSSDEVDDLLKEISCETREV
ncbi:MAG: 5'-nucleotidase [Candidatus Hodarchaeota archaeon]